MIGVFVEFAYGDDFDAARLMRIAVEARAKFEGLPALRSKAFTIDAAAGRAVNFYIWESEEAARAFFSDATLEQVSGIYGVRPTLTFVDVCTLVDNAAPEAG